MSMQWIWLHRTRKIYTVIDYAAGRMTSRRGFWSPIIRGSFARGLRLLARGQLDQSMMNSYQP